MAHECSSPPSLPRVYCPELPDPQSGEPTCTIDADQTRHLRKALRVKTGDRVELFDRRGGLAQARVEHDDRERAHCRIERVAWHARSSPWVTVATAVPKGPRSETMIDQLSQLGVDRVIPLRTARSVVHPRPQKHSRFEKTAIESAKQAGRLFLMEIAPLHTLDEVLTTDEPLTFALSARGEPAEPDRASLRATGHLRLLIGPEGGFADEELDRIRAAGGRLWTIASTVLRIETAAVAGAAITRLLATPRGP